MPVRHDPPFPFLQVELAARPVQRDASELAQTLSSSRYDVRICRSSRPVISSFEVENCPFNCFPRIPFCSPVSVR
jgi:hypothetical protein